MRYRHIALFIGADLRGAEAYDAHLFDMRVVVSHIGLGAQPAEVDAIVNRAAKLGCEIVHHDPADGEARFVDPDGMDCELEGPDLGWADPDSRDGDLDL